MKTVLCLFILFIDFRCMLFAQKTNGFEITGHLEGLKDGEVIRLANRFADWHIATWMDSCKVEHGGFHLKSKVSVDEGPRVYEIWVDPFEEKGRSRYCVLLIDNGDKIWLKGGDINKMPRSEFGRDVYIEGSPSCSAWNSLFPLYFDFERCYSVIDHRLAKIQDSVGFDRELVENEIEAKHMVDNGLDAAFTDVTINGPAVPIIMNDINQVVFGSHYHAAFVPDLYNRLDEHTRNSYYGKMLQKYARLSVGQIIPTFNLKTPEEKLISLKDFVSKNKVTILHFWASKSVERQRYQHELKVFYRKYHGKGLDIIGVSADSVASNWKEMIEEEEYPWVNVSDLKGNGNGGIVNDIYNEGGHAVPNTTNVLLDSAGKIIAWDVSGVELQWYLWKYFGN